ncbi:MAG TPA: ThiF family adenylyltransferase, partial [Solirubrobacterales bacterium]|nr:ThiF family adenylyltransferase [Solirubrobacterales bacterium]
MSDWRHRFPAIYAEEQRFWARKGFEETKDERGRVGFRGTITVRRKAHQGLELRDFLLSFDYPAGFPHVQPRVRFIEPRIEGSRHQAPGRDGAPCLFPPRLWDLQIGPGELYEATRRWLGHHLAGDFPRELAHYELPAYFPPSGEAVLLSAEAMLGFAEERAGGAFFLVSLLGHPISVLESVDGRRVGGGLLDALADRKLRGERRPVKWYRLDTEPKPFNTSRPLEQVLAESGHRVGFGHDPKKRRHSVGLVFPDQVFEEERLLIVDVAVHEKDGPQTILKGCPVRTPELHVVSRERMQRRIEAVRPLARLRERSVTCFGLGAIGSHLAPALTREGVGSLTLCDPDRLRPGNVVRHVLDLTAVGQGKALAMETAVERINPEIETDPQEANLDDPGVIATAIRGADLVIAAIGEEPAEDLLFEVLCEAEEPPAFLCVRTLHGGDAFRVFVVRPGLDACLGCLRAYKDEGAEEWIEVPDGQLGEVQEEGCATSALPGAGLAFAQAAGFAASRALDLLEGRDPGANHWLWVERPIP